MNRAIEVAWIVVVAIITGCERQPIDRTEGSSGENKAFVQRWIEEGFNRQNLIVVDELFSEQFSVNGQTIGRDGLRMSMSRHLVAFPDLHVTIDDIIAEGDKVGIWYTVEGTHRGEFEGFPATGNSVKWSGFDLLTVEHGKITEARFLSDFYGLVAQLGAKQQTPEAAPR